MKRSLPTPTFDRLAKLIPRLASDHDGDIRATVAAIRRTLEGAGHDLNDLGEHIAAGNPFAPMGLNSGWPYTSSRPTPPRPAPPSKPPRPRVPTFRGLGHFGRCEWLERFANSPLIAFLGPEKRAAFEDLRTKIIRRPQEILSRKEINLFNHFVQLARGNGPQREEAA